MSIRYTRELLEEAARETTNANDAVQWCGGMPTPGSRTYLRRKMAELEIDISHFSDMRVRHTEARLRELVAHSTSVAEVVRRLGISPVGGNQAHIGRRITALRPCLSARHQTEESRGSVCAASSPATGSKTRVPSAAIKHGGWKGHFD